MLAKVGDKSIPVTLDSRATISILPKEIVPPEALTGKEIEARCVNKSTMMLKQAFLEMTVNEKVIKRMGGVIARSFIDWIGILSCDCSSTEQVDLMCTLMKSRNRMTDAEAQYDQTTTHQQSWTDKGVVQDSVVSGVEVHSGGQE